MSDAHVSVVDHLVVAAERLAEGVEHVEDMLGVTMPDAGGAHPLMGTHNRLLAIGDMTYLEVIAIDPDAPPPGRARWFGLDAFTGPPRLHAWVARVADIARCADLGLGEPIAATRGDLSWTITIPADGRRWFDGAVPYLIEWGGRHPADSLPDSGCRLRRLVAHGPNIDDVWDRIGLADARVSRADGEPGLVATFDTPTGVRSV